MKSRRGASTLETRDGDRHETLAQFRIVMTVVSRGVAVPAPVIVLEECLGPL